MAELRRLGHRASESCQVFELGSELVLFTAVLDYVNRMFCPVPTGISLGVSHRHAATTFRCSGAMSACYGCLVDCRGWLGRCLYQQACGTGRLLARRPVSIVTVLCARTVCVTQSRSKQVLHAHMIVLVHLAALYCRSSLQLIAPRRISRISKDCSTRTRA